LKSSKERHPSRMCVVENLETGDRYLWDILNGQKYDHNRYGRVTMTIPLPEKYWNLPRYKKGE
jgi:hypothetical protein